MKNISKFWVILESDVFDRSIDGWMEERKRGAWFSIILPQKCEGIKLPILCSRTKISVAARKIKLFFGQKVKLATKRRPIFCWFFWVYFWHIWSFHEDQREWKKTFSVIMNSLTVSIPFRFRLKDNKWWKKTRFSQFSKFLQLRQVINKLNVSSGKV